jgi:hypothetical protein
MFPRWKYEKVASGDHDEVESFSHSSFRATSKRSVSNLILMLFILVASNTATWFFSTRYQKNVTIDARTPYGMSSTLE